MKRHGSWLSIFAAGALAVSAVLGADAGAAAASTRVAVGGSTCADCWHPGPSTTWQYQLSGTVDTSVVADAYSIDAVETPASVVAELHDAGRHVVCYIDAGSWERWRPDADQYPDSVLGKPLDGWPGERWLDIRRLRILRPLLRARMDVCVSKGFDAIDFDNVEGYANDSGFPLTGADQERFDLWLAAAAHARGLSVGLKNDLGQVADLEPSYDFAINEQCFFYHECGRLQPFTSAGKSVMVVEYDLARSQFCARAAELGYFAMRKHLPLGAWRKTC